MKPRHLFVCIAGMLPILLFAQGSHENPFRLYRDLPLLSDTSQLYFISWIYNNVTRTTEQDIWQIRENNRGGSWNHVASNPSISQANTNSANFEPQYFWKNSDTSICVFEFELDSLLATHKGYYGCISTRLRYGVQRDSGYTCTLRVVPRPDTIRSRPYPPGLVWRKALYDTATNTGSHLGFNPILGYSVFRADSMTGPTGPWTRCDPEGPTAYQPYADTVFYDSTAPPLTKFYYAIRLVYAPVKTFVGPVDTVRVESRLSETSPLVPVGVEENESPNLRFREIDFRVMPNPTRTSVRFQIGSSDNEAVAWSIYNSSGRLVRSLKPGARMTWNRRDAAGVLVANGVYFVSLKTKDGIITRKLILE